MPMLPRGKWDRGISLLLLAAVNFVGFQVCLRLSMSLGYLGLAGVLAGFTSPPGLASNIIALLILNAVMVVINVIVSQLALGDLGWALLNHAVVYYLSGLAFGVNSLVMLMNAPASLIGVSWARSRATGEPQQAAAEFAEVAEGSLTRSTTYFLAGFGASYTTHLLLFYYFEIGSPRAYAPYPVSAYILTLAIGLALSAKLREGPLLVGALAGMGPAGLVPLLYYSFSGRQRAT